MDAGRKVNLSRGARPSNEGAATRNPGYPRSPGGCPPSPPPSSVSLSHFLSLYSALSLCLYYRNPVASRNPDRSDRTLRRSHRPGELRR
uniref:Uncharacterized protein n=1 Tax=Anopheles albimanus TaxID=7167 RepID=A0A182FZG8_ANOAL